jgi:nucleobase:cation symporter-1, NCS1 family
MSGLNAVISNSSPMILNQPDLGRYAKKPGEAGWYQGIAMFIVKNLVTFVRFFPLVVRSALG